MHIQQSFKNERASLYIIPTPIGNLDDMTIRAIKTLQEVDILFCEDTRVTRKLLNHFEITVPTKSYHEYNKENTDEYIIELLAGGKKIGLVSDAGMPGISDPGFNIIKLAKDNDFNVIILPGASAYVLGLIHSNFIDEKFQYVGFLNKQKSKKLSELQTYMQQEITTVFYESVHKIIQTLELIVSIDPNYQISVGRELTKINEEYISGDAGEVLSWFSNNMCKGEFVVVLKAQKQVSETMPIIDHVNKLIADGLTKKEAIKEVAKLNKLNKNQVYMQMIEEDNE